MHSIERDGLESPKQLNCSSKRFFEEKGGGEGSNPITPHFTMLSHEKLSKLLTLYLVCHSETDHCNKPWH